MRDRAWNCTCWSLVFGMLIGSHPALSQEASPPLPPPPAASPEAGLATPLATDQEPSWRVTAFLQNQTGVFVARDQAAFDKDGNPTNHGGMFGKLSMSRFTFQATADWRPTPRVWTHLTLRVARSLATSADDDAQVPEGGYAGTKNAKRRREWVRDRYYNETSLREFFVNFRATPWLDLRLGKQLVAWGEAGSNRLMDVVNPVDATWHFGMFESFEDQRMPLWMVRVMADIPALRGGLDVVWVPMLPLFERGEDTVSVPLTFVGAFGLPTPPKQLNDSIGPKKIYSKTLDVPHEFGKDSRVGFRWKGQAGPHLGYSLMYWWGHQWTPPIPQYTLRPGTWDEASQDIQVTRGTYEVVLGFPRQHVIGLSLEGQVPFPLGTMLKLEAALEPSRTFARWSAAAQKDPEVIQRDGDWFEKVPFQARKLLVFNYQVTLQQPFWIRPVNREEPFLLVLQFRHQVIPSLDDLDRDGAVVDVPGYDSTVVSKHQFQIVGALTSTFFQGIFTPRVAAGFIPKTTTWNVERMGEIEKWTLKRQSSRHGSGFASVALGFRLGDSMRAQVAYHHFFGDDPYDGLGFFRDRDEVNFTFRYQF